MAVCVQEISCRLARMPEVILSQIHSGEGEGEEGEEFKKEEKEEERKKEEEEEECECECECDTPTIAAVMSAARAVDRKLREVEECVGLPGEGCAGPCAARMPDVNALLAHLMSVTRAQTERLRGRLARAQAVLSASGSAVAPPSFAPAPSDNDNEGDNANENENKNEDKEKEGEEGGEEVDEKEENEENEENEAMIRHLHEQLEDWEATMRALPLLAERLRSLRPVEECARGASRGVDRVLGEQYQSLEALREVRRALAEVERRLGENRAVIESNIRCIREAISSAAHSSSSPPSSLSPSLPPPTPHTDDNEEQTQ